MAESGTTATAILPPWRHAMAGFRREHDPVEARAAAANTKDAGRMPTIVVHGRSKGDAAACRGKIDEPEREQRREAQNRNSM